MNKVWLISDTHFFHSNIIDYENRPFRKEDGSTDAEKMNEVMISNWNSVVGNDDKVFHLGDFVFGNKLKISEILKKLKGRKILIMGNHDRKHSVKAFLECGFENVYKHSIIYNDVILSHKPIDIHKLCYYKNVHGHVHTKSLQSDRHINVSAEVNNYTPILWDKLAESL